MTDREKILIAAPKIVSEVHSWGGSQRMHYLADMLEKQGENVMILYPEYHEPFSFLRRPRERRLKDDNESILECISKNEIKKIIIGAPSFELFSAAEEIKKRDESIKIIFDYYEPRNLRKEWKELTYLNGKGYLQYADCFICFSEKFRRDVCEAFGLNMNKTEVIYTGYSEEAWKKAEENRSKNKPENERLVITYAGGGDFNSSKRNGRSLNILMKAVEKQPEDSVELKLVSVGSVADMKRRNKIKRQNNLKRQDSIKYIGKVSQEESFHYMMDSDVLLNIQDIDCNYDKYLVPEEFYDYMRSGKAIWNIGRYDGLAAKFLEEYGLGISCENEAERIEEVLEGLIAWKKQGKIGRLRSSDGRNIMGFSQERQNEKYRKVLEKL